mgnify:FL=1
MKANSKALLFMLFSSVALIGTNSLQAQALAERHSQKGLSCQSCHGQAQPKAGDTVANDQCLQCHGPLEKLQAKFADKKEYNPHKNHLGDIDCVLCHKGHSQSVAYCQECHQDFKMSMR